MFLVFLSCSKEGAIHESSKYSYDGVNIKQNIDKETAVLILNRDESATLHIDMESILSFNSRTYTTYDPWDETTVTYTGVPLYEFLKYFGLSDENKLIEIIATNDYIGIIKTEDLKKYDYLLSYKMEGKFYYEYGESNKNKGNLAIAINFDKHKDLPVDIYKHQLVWWIKEMRIK